VRVGFGPDDTIFGVEFELPHITPEMYRAVKAAKENVKTYEEIKVLAGPKFIETGLEKGWVVDTKPEEANEVIAWFDEPEYILKEKPNVPMVLDYEPYLIWRLNFNTYKNAPDKKCTWWVDVNAVTGETVMASCTNTSDEG